MEPMNRRNFLTGMVAASVGTAALVQLATPAEAAALVVGRQVELTPGDISSWPTPAISQQLYWRDVEGQYKPFGLLTDLTWSREIVDATAFGDASFFGAQGITRVEFRGIAIGPMSFPLPR